MHRFLIPLCLVVLAGCEQPRILTGDPSVAILTEGQVTACDPLTRITTTTGVFGNIGRAKALELARNEARNKAADAGANALVFITGGPGDADALHVEAATYRC